MTPYNSKFQNGAFQNFSITPQLAEGMSMWSVSRQFFSRPANTQPAHTLPSAKTDLRQFHSKQPAIFWFGHSSYLIHIGGFNILIDPVFSGHASPFSFYLKAFAGSDIYKPADMPKIDLLILSHNHYDHLDKATIRALDKQVKSIVVPLGVSKDLRNVISDRQKITELDWWQSLLIADEATLTATPARHFSGRGLKRNGSLWASYVLKIMGYSLFLGGDSGYDSHFKVIGDQYGPFDIALLECGQYNAAWPYIHSMPEELIAEARELRAHVVMPVHWAKFVLALHPWNEPVKRFIAAADAANIPYTTPMIGEPVIVGESYPRKAWWESL